MIANLRLPRTWPTLRSQCRVTIGHIANSNSGRGGMSEHREHTGLVLRLSELLNDHVRKWLTTNLMPHDVAGHKLGAGFIVGQQEHKPLCHSQDCSFLIPEEPATRTLVTGP